MIQYLRGDATKPCTGNGIIAHVCNNAGGWGAGFVLAVSKRWKHPEESYRRWAREKFCPNSGAFELGHTQIVPVTPDIWVANMIAQDGYGHIGRIPLQYDALEKCLGLVADEALDMKLSVHMPRIGCGLAGGTWDKVGPIVEKTLEGVDVYVYDF